MVKRMNQSPIYKSNTEVSVDGLIHISYDPSSSTFIHSGEHHAFWELVYVDKGCLVSTEGSNRHLLKAGELEFHRPDVFHTLQMHDRQPVDVIVISFCCSSPILQLFGQKTFLLDQPEKQCLFRIVQEAETAYVCADSTSPDYDLRLREDAPFACEQMLKSTLEQLLILLCRRSDTGTAASNQPPHHAKTVQQVQDYLCEHYNQRITLEFLADRQNISMTLLKRIFKEQTGTTIITYLTDLRIEAAKRMIQEGNLNFSQIAEAVGYDNIYYFSNLFKKNTGMTLTEYAKSARR